LEANKLQLETEEVTPRDPKFSFNTGTLGVPVFEDLQQAVRLGFSVRAKPVSALSSVKRSSAEDRFFRYSSSSS
jgi:hypothetical protein